MLQRKTEKNKGFWEGCGGRVGVPLVGYKCITQWHGQGDNLLPLLSPTLPSPPIYSLKLRENNMFRGTFMWPHANQSGNRSQIKRYAFGTDRAFNNINGEQIIMSHHHQNTKVHTNSQHSHTTTLHVQLWHHNCPHHPNHFHIALDG